MDGLTIHALTRGQRMSDVGWSRACDVGSNGHDRHYGMVELMRRTKKGFLKLMFALLDENADERNPYIKNLWT
jgi:hypothetical protein